MGLFRAPDRPVQQPHKRSRLSLLLFLIIVYAGARVAGSPSLHLFAQLKSSPSQPAILYPPDFNDEWAPSPALHFAGKRVRGNGTYLDLGSRHTHLPASLLTRIFPDEFILPSCLTQLSPSPVSSQAARPLPVRDDWPGFYGAPWIARLDDNLLAILHVYAPRNGALPVTPPEFQIYAQYNGKQTAPTIDVPAAAIFQRGSKSVLYRVFPNSPIRCLDLVVQNGENNGVGHLYYQKYHHYYEMDTTFHIQP